VLGRSAILASSSEAFTVVELAGAAHVIFRGVQAIARGRPLPWRHFEVHAPSRWNRTQRCKAVDGRAEIQGDDGCRRSARSWDRRAWWFVLRTASAIRSSTRDVATVPNAAAVVCGADRWPAAARPRARDQRISLQGAESGLLHQPILILES
jgi:hypothetical protein